MKYFSCDYFSDHLHHMLLWFPLCFDPISCVRLWYAQNYLLCCYPFILWLRPTIFAHFATSRWFSSSITTSKTFLSMSYLLFSTLYTFNIPVFPFGLREKCHPRVDLSPPVFFFSSMDFFFYPSYHISFLWQQFCYNNICFLHQITCFYEVVIWCISLFLSHLFFLGLISTDQPL